MTKTMKKIFQIFCTIGILTLPLLLTSCGEQRTVNRTARAFLQSFYVENNFEAAALMSTRMTQENIGQRAMMFRLNPNSENMRFHNFRITDSEVRTTRATVFYILDDEVERRLNLSRIDGQWLIDMPESTSLNPAFSISPVRSSGGFASAMSEPVRLRDIPAYNPNE